MNVMIEKITPNLFFLLIIFSLTGCGDSALTPLQDDSVLGSLQNDDGEHMPPDQLAQTNLELGIEYMKLGKYQLALSRFKKALYAAPNYADAYSALAILYDQYLGKVAEAGGYYQRAVELNPHNPDVLNNYGQFLCKTNQWQKADLHFNKALENPVYPTPYIPYTNAGICMARQKKYAKAESYLHKALNANPNFGPALYQMANIDYERKDYLKAHDYLERYAKAAQHTPQTLWLGVRVERALNNRDAEATYAIALRSKYPHTEETQLLNKSVKFYE